jgi:hypothetical protein
MPSAAKIVIAQCRKHLAASGLHPRRKFSAAADQLDGTSSPGSLKLGPKRANTQGTNAPSP